MVSRSSRRRSFPAQGLVFPCRVSADGNANRALCEERKRDATGPRASSFKLRFRSTANGRHFSIRRTDRLFYMMRFGCTGGQIVVQRMCWMPARTFSNQSRSVYFSHRYSNRLTFKFSSRYHWHTPSINGRYDTPQSRPTASFSHVLADMA